MKTTHSAMCACTDRPMEIDIEDGRITAMRVDGEPTWRNVPPDVLAHLLTEHNRAHEGGRDGRCTAD